MIFTPPPRNAKIIRGRNDKMCIRDSFHLPRGGREAETRTRFIRFRRPHPLLSHERRAPLRKDRRGRFDGGFHRRLHPRLKKRAF